MKIIASLLFLISSVFAGDFTEIHTLYEIEINSSINPSTLSYVTEALKKSNQDESSVLLIKLNTPGGLVSTTKDIITEIGKSKTAVIVWVTPEGASATSAGAIISSSAHFLFMSEGTNIGAATPIQMGEDIPKDARSKAVNDLTALVESLTEARGRNPEGYAQMISKAASYKSQEALKKKLINGIANDLDDIKNYIQGKIVKIQGENHVLTFPKKMKVVKHEMDSGQKLLNILADPSLAYILFLIGAALLYFEMQAPGGFISGAMGVIFIILAGIGFQVLPLNWGALGLIALSFILFILEAYITSYGVLTFGGIGSLVFGSLFLFRSDSGNVHLESSLIISAVAGISVMVVLIAYVIYKDRKQKAPSDFFSPLDELGVITAILENQDGVHFYKVKAAGSIWKAKSSQQFKIGEKIKIINNDKDHLLLEIDSL